MRDETYIRRCRVPAPVDALERWHRSPAALERLLPPWGSFRVVEAPEELRPGTRVSLELAVGPVRVPWIAEHLPVDEGRGFRDRQVRGPFAGWEHLHRFEPAGGGTSILEDRIRYRLPLGTLGRLLAGRAVRRRVDRTFAYRHRIVRADVAAHHRRGRELHVALTGGSGLVGRHLSAYLRAGGHRVTRLVRREPRPGREEVRWDPTAGYVDTDGLGGVNAVVHLAGENIFGLWTERKKAAIRNSRVHGTRALAEALASMTHPPEVLVSTSAVGYYGDRGDDLLSEESGPGEGFLARVCREWEEATLPAAEAGVRVARLRLGIVLTPAGGALERMVPAFALGLGGRIGTGRQYVSWISIDDLVELVHHVLVTGELEGPVNAVSPQPVRNVELTRTLAGVLSRWAPFAIPASVLRRVAGEMAEEMFLKSARVVPAALESTGYEFRHRRLEAALRHLLGRTEEVDRA